MYVDTAAVGSPCFNEKAVRFRGGGLVAFQYFHVSDGLCAPGNAGRFPCRARCCRSPVIACSFRALAAADVRTAFRAIIESTKKRREQNRFLSSHYHHHPRAGGRALSDRRAMPAYGSISRRGIAQRIWQQDLFAACRKLEAYINV